MEGLKGFRERNFKREPQTHPLPGAPGPASRPRPQTGSDDSKRVRLLPPSAAQASAGCASASRPAEGFWVTAPAGWGCWLRAAGSTHAKSVGSGGSRAGGRRTWSSRGRRQDLGASLGPRVRLRKRVTWTCPPVLPAARSCRAAARR